MSNFSGIRHHLGLHWKISSPEWENSPENFGMWEGAQKVEGVAKTFILKMEDRFVASMKGCDGK
jgi:hypothetical protein